MQSNNNDIMISTQRKKAPQIPNVLANGRIG